MNSEVPAPPPTPEQEEQRYLSELVLANRLLHTDNAAQLMAEYRKHQDLMNGMDNDDHSGGGLFEDDTLPH